MIADETAPSHHDYQDHLSAYANMSSHHDYQDHLHAAFMNRGMGVLVEKGGFTPLEFDEDHSKNVGCGLEVMGLRVSQDCAVRSRVEVEAGSMLHSHAWFWRRQILPAIFWHHGRVYISIRCSYFTLYALGPKLQALTDSSFAEYNLNDSERSCALTVVFAMN